MGRKIQTVICVAVLASMPASAGNYDGTWRGKVEDWQVSLTVAGTKGKLSLINCNGGVSDFEIDVGADGKIDVWLKDQITARRRFEAQLPKFTIPPGGRCKGGTADLARQ